MKGEGVQIDEGGRESLKKKTNSLKLVRIRSLSPQREKGIHDYQKTRGGRKKKKEIHLAKKR